MKKLFLCMAAIAALVGCSKEVSLETPQGVAIGFNNTFVDNATRSIDPSLTKENFGFTVYGYMGDALIFNAQATDESGGYTPTQYWAPNKTYEFAAIAPSTTTNKPCTPKWTVTGNSLVSADATTNKPAHVQVSMDFTNDGTQDLLFATADATQGTTVTATTVGFTFKHMLSKVRFSFTNNVTSTADYQMKVTDIKVKANKKGKLVAGTDYTWTLDGTDMVELDFGNAVATNETNANAAAVAFVKSGNTASTVTTVTSNNEMLLIPIKTSDKFQVSFKVELLIGTTSMASKTIEYFDVTNVELKQGYCYDFKAALTEAHILGNNPPQIQFSVTEVSTWDNQDENKTFTVSTN